ncbi:hypothetical protein VN97_g12858 [Penicillium thymicola]|uniref:Uncharacterized protein n=1 Tax=Penicillium thymicola TaxID=293382 RepID=A0AAI9T4T9_PENTH|nr:hypothetical protein VN97_g12858 [Penicillium thymicola]
MAAVARISQKVSARVGHTIHIEAVRVERDKTPTKPLQAYMVEEAIVKHSIPWQQVLMFFARTQVPHEWSSPKYSFTRRQQRAWEKLWDGAQAVAQSSRAFSPTLCKDTLTQHSGRSHAMASGVFPDLLHSTSVGEIFHCDT